jgi:peptidoglycan/xylan/chitin deacetylase (PgdA/CDA1 family)
MPMLFVMWHASKTMVIGLLAVEHALANPPILFQPDSLRVPILVYHSIAPHHLGQTTDQRELDVDPAVFHAQMSYIAQAKHPVISLSSLVDAIEGRVTLPQRAVVITFDDGWQSQYEDAFRVLKQYGFTATFFVYTGAIGNGPAFMTWDEVEEMQKAGMTIGAHSRTHPELTKKGVSLAKEINGSRDDIQRNLGTTPELFAYPYGDWDDRVAAAVRAAGFRAARGMGDGPLNTHATLYALKSVLTTDDMPAFERALGDHEP